MKPKRFGHWLENTSSLVMVLKPDLTIVGASEPYTRATLLWREQIEGCHLFEVFPDNPNDPEGSGARPLRASFDQVIRHNVPHHMATQRYDVRDHVSDPSKWMEKHWNAVNTPVFGKGSKEITYFIHEVTDVTQTVLLRRWIEEQSILVEEQRATLEQMLLDFNDRQSALRSAHEPLLALDRGTQPAADEVEEIRSLLKAPDSRIYFQVGERVPFRGLYEVFHRSACALVPRIVFVEAGAMFPRCLRCGSSVLYRLTQRFWTHREEAAE